MMAPHWLDEVFEDPDKASSALVANARFKEAIAKAQAAYYEAQEVIRKNPGICGASPAQQARTAFLDSLTGE
ncbi:MAG: hypothetical protein JSS49_30350 [Planctomycetes bacterium]|nr:hypothetical protein [Planctomycetota bacterium]